MNLRFTNKCIVIGVLFHGVYAYGQTIVKGNIVSDDKLPVADCIIVSTGKNTAISDSGGRFEIEIKKGNDTLIFNLLGYEVLKVPVQYPVSRPLRVELVRRSNDLEEVVINTGYFALPRERITGSFEVINRNLINRSVTSNLLDRLEGAASVYFDRRAGASGVSIRGRSTILANPNPLIIVDGVPYDGSFSSINPNDVQNVTVLKDAAAASIWGARAANGVLVVETVKGKFNQKPMLEFTSNFTYGSKPDLYYNPAMTSRDFMAVEKELFAKGYYNSNLNDVRYPVISPAVELLAAHRSGRLTSQDLEARLGALEKQDVREDLGRYFYRNSFDQQYSLSYRGGMSNYNYNLSVGWDENRSNVKRNSNSRLTLLSANSIKPVNKLLVEMLLGFTSGENVRNVTMPSISPTGKSLYPYARLADDDGNASVLEKDYRIAFLDSAGNGRLLDWKYRPLEELYMADNSSRSQNLRVNAGVKYDVIKDLRFEARYQYELQEIGGREHFSEKTYTARNLINRYSRISGSTVVRPVPLGGILDLSSNVLISQTGRSQLNYNTSWKLNHSLSSIIGTEIRQTSGISHNTRTYGYDNKTLVYQNVNYTDIFATYNRLNGNQRIINPADFNERLNRYVSYYTNTAYTYRDRYSFSMSARKDASNLFGVNHNKKGVPLWSAGASWEISKEPYYRSKVIDYLKTRFSYGVSGNIDNSLSALTTVAFYSNSPLSGYDYAMMRNPGNPDLRWERQYMLNTGIDFASKNNVVSGTVDLFLKNGDDLIGESLIDPTTGVTNNVGLFRFKGNVAHMRGYGIDAALNFSKSVNALKVSSTLIFGYSINRVTRYMASSNVASPYVGFGTLVNPIEGKPVYSIYSYKWAGLDPLTGDPLGELEGQASKNYQAIMSSSPNTLVYHGSAIPVYFGSFRNNFEYKRWSISANMIYKLGYYFRRTSINYSTLFSSWNHHSDYSRRWQQPGDEGITYVPSLVYPAIGPRDSFYSGSEVLVERGDHIRFHDLNVSYQAGSPAGNKKIHLYLYLRNIGIIWKANNSNLDPDFYNGGIPSSLNISVGLKTTI